ncbi:hypothetical protein HPB51_003039 [Rhipicephalus microplus]|uniref:Uncharacterized protein n=1 Tax=Rhipicephalus microplus TaxID=6941 RepID=A0A9J6E569_RHIMP|nr:hypothetical protein HPB51_003039 [Rhipicephalus microplus]
MIMRDAVAEGSGNFDHLGFFNVRKPTRPRPSAGGEDCNGLFLNGVDPNLIGFNTGSDGSHQDKALHSTILEHEASIEARLLLTDPTADKPKLTGFHERLSARKNKLLKINEALEERLADEELEAEYVGAAEYNEQAISMLAETRCKIDGLDMGDYTAGDAYRSKEKVIVDEKKFDVETKNDLS